MIIVLSGVIIVVKLVMTFLVFFVALLTVFSCFLLNLSKSRIQPSNLTFKSWICIGCDQLGFAHWLNFFQTYMHARLFSTFAAELLLLLSPGLEPIDSSNFRVWEKVETFGNNVSLEPAVHIFVQLRYITEQHIMKA